MSQTLNPRDIRSGHTILWNNAPCLVIEHSFNNTAQRSGIVKCKIKNLYTKSITTEDFTNKKIIKAIILKITVIFSYQTKDEIIFLNIENYEEIKLKKNNFKRESLFLEEGIEVKLMCYEESIIDLILPEIVALKIKSVEPSKTKEYKKIITESGLEVNVPSFFKETETLNVTTFDGKYKSR